jgi:glycosyltransferase involved in cell wall biosynthesis
MNNTPLVSIIIPTYNRADLITSAISSALFQTYTNIQIIVVDDGSTDNTAEVLTAYPQVEYIVQEHAGQAAARNNGLKYSKGVYITSLDSDDVWNPDFLERCVKKLEEDNLDFVFANWYQYTDQEAWDHLLYDPYLQPYLKKTPDHWITLNSHDARELYTYSCSSPSSSAVIRKSSIVSGWDDTIIIGDDWCMYLDILLNKECTIAFTMDRLWKKRADSNNIYDGRKRSDILKYLYVADGSRMMEKFKDRFTPREMAVFHKRYIESLVELSKHAVLRSFDLPEAFKLLGRALSKDVVGTLVSIPKIIFLGLKRKISPEKVDVSTITL